MQWAKAAFITLLASLFLSPTFAQEAGIVTVNEVIASNSDLRGQLAGLYAITDLPLDLHSLVIHGNFNGTVESDTSELVVNGAHVQPDTHATQWIDAHNATLRAVSSDAGVRLLVEPVEALAIATATSATLVPRLAATSFLAETFAGGDIVLPTAETVQTSAIGGHLEIRGTIKLTIYAANFTLEDGNGRRNYETGLVATPYTPPGTPGLPGIRGAESTTQSEAYLTVTDAILSLNLAPAWTLHTNETAITAGGSMELIAATGKLAVAGVARELNGNSVQLTGDVTFHPRANQQATFQGSLTGTPDTLRIDGTTVPIQEPSPGRGWLWPLLLVPLAVILYVGYRVAAKRGLQGVEQLLERHEYHAAIRRATKLMWLPRAAEDAVVAQAVAWLKLDQPSKAKAALDAKPKGRDRIRPGRLFLRARIAGIEGQIEEAKHLLLDCLLLAPNYLLDALADPVLGPLVKDVQAEMNGAYA